MEPSRRRVLRTAPAALGALAGCEALDGRSATTTTTSSSGDGVAEADVPGRTIIVANQSGDDQFVSIAAHHGGRVVDSTTVEVPHGATRRVTLSAPSGLLDVDLETTTGLTGTVPWYVATAVGPLTVTVRPAGLDATQRAWCTPACPPLSSAGDASGTAYAESPVFVRASAGVNLILRNTTAAPLDAHVTISDGDERILDYRYTVPPTVTLDVPGVLLGSDYDVTVRSSVGEHSTTWQPPMERQLHVRLNDDGVQSSCGRVDAALRLRNTDDREHTLYVTVYQHGEDLPTFTRSYRLPAGASVLDNDVLTGSGRYDLVVESAAGGQASTDWWLCPPRGPTRITVADRGAVTITQSPVA